MTLGIPKKYEKGVLIVLGAAVLYFFYVNVIAGPSAPAPSASRTAKSDTGDANSSSPSVAMPGSTPGASTQPARVPGRSGRNDSFTPVFKSKRPENQPDPRRIDPTLHLEALTKLQSVPPAGGRDLFNWGSVPAPTAALGPTEPRVLVQPVGPRVQWPPPVVTAPVKPPPPPPPPINLKYYGIATRLDNGKKTAFFMDGEEILIEAEGATFGARYKLIRIGVNSAVVEDTQYKRQQTLPLEEGPMGSGL
jgi:hypothetical protein